MAEFVAPELVHRVPRGVRHRRPVQVLRVVQVVRLAPVRLTPVFCTDYVTT